MRQKLVIGNWKMHGGRDQADELVKCIVAGFKEVGNAVQIGVCPSFIRLEAVAKLLAEIDFEIRLGAQNVYYEDQGAYTGEVAAKMLAEIDVSLVIIGHSERREIFGETDSLVAAKFEAVQTHNMVPILCIGESFEERERGITNQAIIAQLDAVLDRVGVAAFRRAVIAYEPIWAIGTGVTATPEQAQEVHWTLRDYLAKRDAAVASAVRIIYGGSVNSANAREIFNQVDVDGGLVGGASLKAEEFLSICKSAN